MAEDYPDIEATHRYADAAANELVASPGHFDVIATENFIGDILSDVGAATIGGLGLCPAANIGAAGAYFEPAHGSAPELAGADAANPIAQILSAAMMLEHLGEAAHTADIRAAVGLVLSEGAIVLAGSGQPAAGLRHAAAAIAAAIGQRRNAEPLRNPGLRRQPPSPSPPQPKETMEPAINNIKKILIIGSGAMGSQIGMVAALAGYDTVIQDIAGRMLEQARTGLLQMDAQGAKGRLTAAEAGGALGRLSFTTDLAAAAAEADFVIEAATEKLEIKRPIFARLGQLAPAHAVLATNSSTLGSSAVAEASGRPSLICNMHFFNPSWHAGSANPPY